MGIYKVLIYRPIMILGLSNVNRSMVSLTFRGVGSMSYVGEGVGGCSGYYIVPLHIHATPEVRSIMW